MNLKPVINKLRKVSKLGSFVLRTPLSKHQVRALSNAENAIFNVIDALEKVKKAR